MAATSLSMASSNVGIGSLSVKEDVVAPTRRSIVEMAIYRSPSFSGDKNVNGRIGRFMGAKRCGAVGGSCEFLGVGVLGVGEEREVGIGRKGWTMKRMNGGCTSSYTSLSKRWRCLVRSSAAEGATAVKDRPAEKTTPSPPNPKRDLTVVMKFGGSSLATAERMMEVASLITSFTNERPVVVLSAMGKTTNNLLKAGARAVECGAGHTEEIEEMKFLTDLHLKTAEELGVDRSLVTGLLEELQQLLTGIALMREMTPRTKDYLVSFGERMSTRLFAAYLNKNGVKACQYDAFDIGFTTTDDFVNADILEPTYSKVGDRLRSDWAEHGAMPIVTGFLARGAKTGAITTLGRGGSDLTATAIGKALGLKEIQVWKDVDGVLTADPHLVSKKALPVPYLTFDEAAELAYFGAQVLHPQAMRPARDADIPVRVKNSYNPAASGTLIMRERDMSKALLTSIVLKPHVTMLDIVSTRMLGQFGFLAKVFSIFEDMGISVDCVATSEVSVSLTLDPARMWTRELIQQELDRVVEQLRKIAFVKLSQKKSIISLIGNVERSSLILEKVFSVFRSCGINVQMISQGASKVNISVIVDDDEAELCVKALHCVFFEQEHLVERLIAGYGNGNLEPCC